MSTERFAQQTMGGLVLALAFAAGVLVGAVHHRAVLSVLGRVVPTQPGVPGGGSGLPGG